MFLTDLDYLKRLRPESDSLGDDAVFGKGQNGPIETDTVYVFLQATNCQLLLADQLYIAQLLLSLGS